MTHTEHTFFQVEDKDSCRILTLNRADKLNTLNKAVLDALATEIQKVYVAKAVRGVVLRSAGDKAFAAGADIAQFSTLEGADARAFAQHGQAVFSLIERCPVPVVAAVQGYALGGGCELALACHMRVASKKARFGCPEVSLGLIPGYGGTQRLTQLVGPAKALEWMLTAEMVDAETALAHGLVNHVVEASQLLEAAVGLLKKIAEKAAPFAASQVIACVHAARVAAMEAEADAFAACCQTRDFKEGVQAFLDKRKPSFRGD